MKNSQFFREIIPFPEFTGYGASRLPSCSEGGRHLKDMDGMTYALSKFFVKIFKNSEKIRGPPGVP